MDDLEEEPASEEAVGEGKSSSSDVLLVGAKDNNQRESRALRLVPAPGAKPPTVIDVLKKKEHTSAEESEEARDEDIHKAKKGIAELKGDLAEIVIEAKSKPKAAVRSRNTYHYRHKPHSPLHP